jgi:hypothetical protein
VARVNIEARALAEGRLSKFAKKMGWQKREAIGCLTMFWHDSQEEQAFDADREDILRWIPSVDDDEAEKIFQALLVNRYLSANSDGSYRIHGNEQQINGLADHKEASRLGGVKSGEIRRQRSKSKGGSEGGEGAFEVNSIQLNTTQDNSTHDNSRQEELLPPGSRQAKPEKSGKTTATWDAYSEAYRERHGTDPVRNATVNSQLSGFVKRIGAEEAPLVAAFYVWHNDAFYVKTMHSVGPMLRDAEKLRTEWFTKRRMLGPRAREIERAQHTSDVFDSAAKRLGYTDET